MLKSLQAASHVGSQVLTGMPHTSGVTDTIGNFVVEIEDLEERIRTLNEKIHAEEEKVSEFINSIEIDHVRLIFRLRFLRCLEWSTVAKVIGGRNSMESVKSTCYRYLSSKSCTQLTLDDACKRSS